MQKYKEAVNIFEDLYMTTATGLGQNCWKPLGDFKDKFEEKNFCSFSRLSEISVVSGDGEESDNLIRLIKETLKCQLNVNLLIK